MKTQVVLVSGLPGSGKTHWLNSIEASTIVDIADYYGREDINDPRAAWHMLVEDIKAKIIRDCPDTIYVEGLLFAGTPSLQLVIRRLLSMGVEYELVFVDTHWSVCRERVAQDYLLGKDSVKRSEARNKIISRYGFPDRIAKQREIADYVIEGGK